MGWALAKRTQLDHPELSGRASENTDGVVGKFAQKGHISSLSDFVAQACQVELGLVVVGAHPDDRSADLVAEEAAALIGFVATLPAPETVADLPFSDAGEGLFRQVGCKSRHVESVGPARRLFSDLLLHDMGEGLSDAGLGYAEIAPTDLVAAALAHRARQRVGSTPRGVTAPAWRH